MVNKKVLAVALFTTIFSGNAVRASPIIPGGTAEANLPSENTWGFDYWVFMEIYIPSLPRDLIAVDEEIEGDEIPVLRFDANEGWTHFLDEEGSQIWFYETPVPEGETFTPLFSEWIVTDFHIRNGMSGSTPAEEIEDLMNQNEVKRYCMQSEGISVNDV